MTIRQGLIKAASDFRAVHGEKAGPVGRFFLERQNPNGGFRGKGPQSDLYYTGFAVLGLEALEAEYDRAHVLAYLRSFGGGEGLDLAHLAVLVRLSRLLDPGFPASDRRKGIAAILPNFHNPDGGFHHLAEQGQSSAYGCFLALGVHEDLDTPLEKPQEVLTFLDGLRANSGGYFNERSVPAVSIPATAAAVVTRHLLGEKENGSAFEWMFTVRHGGGFLVLPMAPVADLLSTAVALFACSVCGAEIAAIRADSRAFVDSLWDASNGGFHPNRLDAWSDCEYTFYGMMALGVLGHG